MTTLELTRVEATTLYWVVRSEMKSPRYFDDDPSIGFSREAVCDIYDRLEEMMAADAPWLR